MKIIMTIITLAMIALSVIAASQCLGTTLKGERCKNMTNNSTGYCHLHGGQK
jgi:hypothetical protein